MWQGDALTKVFPISCSLREQTYFCVVISCGNLRHDSLFTEVSGQPTIDLNRWKTWPFKCKFLLPKESQEWLEKHNPKL